MNPDGRMSGCGIGVFGAIVMGFSTPPPVPQQVDVINLAKSHCCSFLVSGVARYRG
jgi:hypothetical protein